ncbi:MAG: hypothetical protein EAY75_09640 [Bacteroidetes bacterium]|nr:MAG: hypothetical protein EAY75_09640 [Bacteroidota bacterium]
MGVIIKQMALPQMASTCFSASLLGLGGAEHSTRLIIKGPITYWVLVHNAVKLDCRFFCSAVPVHAWWGVWLVVRSGYWRFNHGLDVGYNGHHLFCVPR